MTWFGRQAASSPVSPSTTSNRWPAGSCQNRRLNDVAHPRGGRCRTARRRCRARRYSVPVGEQAQRVVPQRVDLDGFAAPRRDDPVADLRVHPGELKARSALAQQAVVRIDADAESRAGDVALDDVDELRQKRVQQRTVARRREITIERVEQPQRRVGRVVQAVTIPLGKQVRQQAVANRARERAQDPFRFGRAARQQRQPLEADHRVAAPVREPVIARDHGALFVAGGAHARGFRRAADRRHDELVRCQHELGGKAFARAPGSAAAMQLAAAVAFRRERRGPFERRDDVPRLRRRDDATGCAARQLEREHARRPGARLVHVAARFLDRVAPLRPNRRRLAERRVRRIDHEPQRRQRRRSSARSRRRSARAEGAPRAARRRARRGSGDARRA